MSAEVVAFMERLALPALTWDVTYHGRPLTQRQYDASMAILRRIEAAGRLSAWASAAQCSDDEHVAWVALGQCGVIETSGSDPKSPTMTWDTLGLTPYGKTYLAQRSA